MFAVKSSFNQIINVPLPVPLLLPQVPAVATSVAAPDSGSCSPGLDGLMVGEVGQGVAALAVYPRAWAKVGGQPVPQLIFEEAQGGHALFAVIQLIFHYYPVMATPGF